ncbi:hypothetical protein M9458_019403, partial [Cirrhinus mrigala]
MYQVKAGTEEPWDELGVWRSELYLSCGVLGLGVLSLLAITSLPSVGNSLNWREFTFVQVRPCTSNQCFPILFLEAHQQYTLWMSLLYDSSVQ